MGELSAKTLVLLHTELLLTGASSGVTGSARPLAVFCAEAAAHAKTTGAALPAGACVQRWPAEQDTDRHAQESDRNNGETEQEDTHAGSSRTGLSSVKYRAIAGEAISRKPVLVPTMNKAAISSCFASNGPVC